MGILDRLPRGAGPRGAALASVLSVGEHDQLLTGWGRTAPSLAHVHAARDVDDVVTLVATAREHESSRGVLARGLGRSYADAAQSGGAVVLDMAGLDSWTFDASACAVTAGGGTSLDALLRGIVPQGAFVPVTPGTRYVTVGGAIAADVHGKNHHGAGSFGSHVQGMEVVNGRAEVVSVKPTGRTAKQFWATTGGMGLTGIITRATFSCIPISSASMLVDTERTESLDDLMARMLARDDEYRYSVAWIDTTHPSGRGVLTRGDHAPVDALPVNRRTDALAYDPQPRLTVPNVVPGGLLNRWSVRAFNEFWFRRHPRSRAGELMSIPAFFHPLDGVGDWNRMYGPRGFIQYQFVVPDDAASIVPMALERLRSVSAPSFLTVLKRFGAANPGPLSFPQPGWTLAADLPSGIPGLARVLDELDEAVASAGGRLYLAKDGRQSSTMLQRTYPGLAAWQAVRRTMDPHGIFTSDLARRLSL